jgi:prepilin-type N-terminal cleavage/methylation domain-containing protein
VRPESTTGEPGDTLVEPRTSERGYTLIELLVAIVLALVVAGAAMSFLIVTTDQQNVVASRAVSARQAEVVLQRLTREVREAQNIVSATTGTNTTPVNVTYGAGSSSVSFYLPGAGSTSAGTRVTWTCTAGASCTRTTGTTTVTELTGVSSANFTPISSSGATLASNAGTGSSPSYPSAFDIALQVKVISQLDAGQTHVAAGITSAITVQDGVTLRNYSS